MKQQAQPKKISSIPSPSLLKKLTDKLCTTDHVFRSIVEQHGYPELWAREEGIATLVKIILEQQVSLASAWATYAKLERYTEFLNPNILLRLTDEEYRSVGVSRQKAGYIRSLVQAETNGIFSTKELSLLPDTEVHARLCALKGIGNWSADIYLLMALRRRDIFPIGDLALQVALRELYNINKEEAEEFSLRWQPLRSVATRILWRYYLSTR